MKLLLVPTLLLAALVGACSSSASGGDPLTIVHSLPYLDGAAPDIGPGKPVVVEFWATWCPPCVASVPHLVEINERLEPDGLVIVGVHSQRGADDESAIRKFTESKKVNYAIARDTSGQAGRAYGINGIPHAFVYDKTGRMVWQGHPMDPKFEAAVEQVVEG